MKKITLLITLLVTTYSFAQTQNNTPEIPGTTVEEYNYMTKGYKIQISSGLDMKNGYSFSDIGTINSGSYKFNYKMLNRVEENEIAGVLITAYSNVSGRTYYLGMPFNNENLSSNFYSSIASWDESMTTAFAQAMSRVSSKMMMNYFLATRE